MRLTRLLLILFALTACKNERASSATGDPVRGRQLIAKYHCTTCHVVPGVDGPRGMLGPELGGFASRSTIAGSVPNTSENVQRWLQNPQAMTPQSSMPNLGITPHDATDLTAYLESLR